jgi:hypothetical protein
MQFASQRFEVTGSLGAEEPGAVWRFSDYHRVPRFKLNRFNPVDYRKNSAGGA